MNIYEMLFSSTWNFNYWTIQISNLTPVCSNFPSSEYSTTRFHCLSSFHECKDRPLTWRGKANYSMCASNWKAAMKLSNLWFSEWSLSKLRGKNATQYWWEEKMALFACLTVQTRSELPFGHTVDCEISAKKIKITVLFCKRRGADALWHVWKLYEALESWNLTVRNKALSISICK